MAAKSSTAWWLTVVAVLGCGRPSTHTTVTLLADDEHSADVLVESRDLAPPPDFGGNRLVRGWYPWKHDGTPVWVPSADAATLEICQIADRPRNLQIDARLLGESGDFDVEVEIDGRPAVSIPLAETIEVPLPADLPRGRVPIQLRFAKAPDPVLLDVRLDRALPPGSVEVEPQRIRQEPSSFVDFTRPIAAGARLVGTFEPPSGPGKDQRFTILLDRPGQPSVTLFDWTADWLDRLRGKRTLSIPLPTEPAPVRLRLVATGSGPPAVWHELGVAIRTPTPVEPDTDTPVAPKVVVLYVLDALRADFVDLSEGPDNPTPILRRLASEGVVFEHHSSVAPNTIPSTKSLFTGHAFLTQGHAKLSAEGPQTLAEAFREAGYRTAVFSGNLYVSDAYGTTRGFDHVADEVVFRGYPDSNEAYNDNAARVQSSALAWVDELGPEDRAFLYLHTIHPHNPYDPPPAITERLTAGIASQISGSTRTLLDIQHNRTDVTAADQQRLAELYRGSLSYNDEQIGLLLDALRQRYPDGQVLLIVTSDHGEELFDHGGVLHGYTLYREQLRIPLLLWWPQHLSHQRIEATTDTLDVHESLRALIGAAPSSASQGRPFWSLLHPARSTARRSDGLQFAAASSVKGGIFMVSSKRYKLVLAPRVGRGYGMGEGRGRTRDAEYLFDLESDPEERHNIAGLRSFEVDWLRSRLDAWIERGTVLEMDDEEEPELDDDAKERLRALGYLE